MKHLYNDHISGVKIEVQKLYSVKVKIIASINCHHHNNSFQKEELDKLMRNLSGESKADIDRILEEFKKAKMVKIIKIIIFIDMMIIMSCHDMT